MNRVNERVKHQVRRSLFTSVNPNLAVQRAEEIDLIDSRVRKLTAYTVHKATVTYPGIASRYAGFDLSEIDHQNIIGMGHDTVVLRHLDEVTKLHIETLAMNHRAQDKYAATKRDSFQALFSRFREFMLLQTVDVGAVPGATARNVVHTDQAYRQLTDVGLFHRNQDTVDSTKLNNLLSLHPSSRGQLARFVQQSFRIHEATGYLPDILGIGNVGIDNATSQLVLIDGYPIEPGDQAILDRTANQLQSLGDQLAA